MHRHGYQGRKFHREAGSRTALVKGLADSLVKYESIETTLPKAKEVVPYLEKLITKAKKGDLHNRRQIIAKLQTVESAHKLVDELAPKMTSRTSGHLRITKTNLRRGDNARLAKVSFVDDLHSAPVAKSAAVVKAKTPSKSANAKSAASRAKPATKSVATRKPATKKAEAK